MPVHIHRAELIEWVTACIEEEDDHYAAIADMLEADGKLRDVIAAELHEDNKHNAIGSLIAIAEAAEVRP